MEMERGEQEINIVKEAKNCKMELGDTSSA